MLIADIVAELKEIRRALEMARKRKRIWSDAERAAHDAHVDGTIRQVHERADAFFAARGEKRPTEIVAQVHERHDTPTS